MTGVLPLLTALALVLQSAPTIEALAPLLGVWDTSDTYHPVSGAPIVENGVRTCERVMRGAYIQCETVVTRPNGGGRVYRFLINHNPNVNRFEMISIWSNVPQKAVQSMTPDATGRAWTLANVAVIGSNEELTPHHSELVFESPDRIVWTGRRVKAGQAPADAPISFNETWTRRRN